MIQISVLSTQDPEREPIHSNALCRDACGSDAVTRVANLDALVREDLGSNREEVALGPLDSDVPEAAHGPRVALIALECVTTL